ncbi:hypothetical protein AB0H82_10725 [Streptomyces sp. NPDC050732]|uniref:hypothetical protein n=1 Tax=Streptomyces sp. NPDC050732 TaxID=3154632 RepID=UPI0034485FEE
MSAAAAPRRARFYTSARRYPWVMGKIGDWRLPLGPYNAAQITLATVGGFVLVKSVGLWGGFGPLSAVPVAAWIVGIWMLRRPKIGGRTPVAAALGLLALALSPAGGRMGHRAARDQPARRLGGGFTIESLPPVGHTPRPVPARRPIHPSRPDTRAGGQPPVNARRMPSPASAAPRSPVHALLAHAHLHAQNPVRTREG